MQQSLHNNIFNNLVGFLLGAVIIFCLSATSNAQNKTIADRNPPLTSSMVERYIGLLEWSLDFQFSGKERAEIEKQIVKYWQTQDEKNIKGIVGSLSFEKSLSSVSQEKKNELQPQVKQKILETMENDRDEPLISLLLAIYKKNKNVNAEAEINAAGDETGAAGIERLVGKWQVLHGNSIVGVDAASGRIGSGNSMIAQYDIRPDGRLIFTFVLQQSNYGCTTRIKTSQTGRIAISGSNLIINYSAGGTTISEDSCNAKNNYKKQLAAEKQSLQYRLEQKSGKKSFCFDSGNIKDCAIKVE
jgi:hypothetical protein